MRTAALYYIEPYYHEKLNQTIEENFQSIEESFKRIGLSFVYLPKLLIDKHFNKVLDYNRPYLQHGDKGDLQKLYQLIIAQYHLKIFGPALVYLSDEPEETQLYELPSGSEEDLLFNGFSKAAFNTFIEEITTKSAEKHRDSGIRFRKGGLLERDKELPFFDSELQILEQAALYPGAETVDADFQREGQPAIYPNYSILSNSCKPKHEN
jgi:hypothetical protein